MRFRRADDEARRLRGVLAPPHYGDAHGVVRRICARQGQRRRRQLARPYGSRGLQLLRTRLDEVVDDTTNWRAILMVQPATASLLKLVLSALLFTSLGVGGYALYDNVAVSEGEQARAQAGTTDPTLEPTGDALLDELRALSRDGSVEELIEARNKLHHCVLTRYQDDPVLWTGIERLAEILLQRPDFPDRLAWSRLIAKLIEDGGEPSEHLLDLVPRLRSVR